jgi:hypothetical protein
METRERGRCRSLLDSRVGGAATVRLILFEAVRERCGELGLHEGDRLMVDGWDADGLRIRNGAADPLHCPAEVARFVVVE